METEAQQLVDYKDYLNKIVNECKNFPGIKTFETHLEKLWVDSSIFETKYAVWVDTSIDTTLQECIDHFVENLSEEILKLKAHSYIVKAIRVHYISQEEIVYFWSVAE